MSDKGDYPKYRQATEGIEMSWKVELETQTSHYAQGSEAIGKLDKGKTPRGSEGPGRPSKHPKLKDTTIKAFFGIDNVSGPPTLASTSAEGNHNTSPPLEEQVVIQLNQNASNEDNNVPTTEDVVTEDNIDVGRKKRKRNVKMGREWEMKRTFQVDWVAKYWFIEPVTNNDEPPTECKCTICT